MKGKMLILVLAGMICTGVTPAQLEPYVGLSSKQFVFVTDEAGVNPPRTLILTKTCDEDLNWIIQTDYSCRWLSVSPNWGFFIRQNYDRVMLTIDLSGMAAGTYTGSFLVLVSNGSGTLQLSERVDLELIVGVDQPSPYGGGRGWTTDPYQIRTAEQMNAIGLHPKDWRDHFVLTEDIDLSSLQGPFNLIGQGDGYGSIAKGFQGTFDGQGHRISGFDYETTGDVYIGLFRGILAGGVIRNLGVIEPAVTVLSAGPGIIPNGVGSLAGMVDTGGRIENCRVEQGGVTGVSVVGCLAGWNAGTIVNCRVTGSVNAEYGAGGLVGGNAGEVANCYSVCSVGGERIVGGLVGHNWGTISKGYSAGAVTGDELVGGLVGSPEHNAVVMDSFWDTQSSGQIVSGGGEGKTTDEMKTLATFTDAGWDFVYSDGNAPVWKMPANDYPKLFWEYRYSGGSGTAEDPYKISTVADWQELIATSADWDKHFVLINDIDFQGVALTPVAPDTIPDNLYFDGVPFSGVFDGKRYTFRNAIISLPAKDYIGLFGCLGVGGQIRNLVVADIAVSGNRFVGGLVGENVYGMIIASYASGDIRGDSYVGGLVGSSEDNLIACSAAGTVRGNSIVGGLAGMALNSISACYASGDVSGSSFVGGLVGDFEGFITACYATGSVGGSSYVGGLVGWFELGRITDSYAASSVSGSEQVGGLVGSYSLGYPAPITDSFWDRETSGCPWSNGGIGKTTAEMKALATFVDAGWDFVGEDINGTKDVWRMCGVGVDYPRLTWEFSGGGDFACPDGVALEDLLYLAERWMANTPETVGAADGNGDGKVDLMDFEVLASNWMR